MPRQPAPTGKADRFVSRSIVRGRERKRNKKMAEPPPATSLARGKGRDAWVRAMRSRRPSRGSVLISRRSVLGKGSPLGDPLRLIPLDGKDSPSPFAIPGTIDNREL